MARRTIGDIEKIWTNVEGMKKLSDKVIGIGPFGIGLDGLLTWVPVVGTAYTLGAAGWLLVQAARVKAIPGARSTSRRRPAGSQKAAADWTSRALSARYRDKSSLK